MTLYESSIYAGLKRLIKLIYTAKFLSTKADRINYIEPNIRYLEKSLCKYIMAYNCQDKRRDYMDECIGAFGVFRVLFEQNRERGVIHFIRKKDKDGKIIEGNEGIPSEEIEIIELIGRVDNDMSKYRLSLSKGKTIIDDKR